MTLAGQRMGVSVRMGRTVHHLSYFGVVIRYVVGEFRFFEASGGHPLVASCTACGRVRGVETSLDQRFAYNKKKYINNLKCGPKIMYEKSISTILACTRNTLHEPYNREHTGLSNLTIYRYVRRVSYCSVKYVQVIKINFVDLALLKFQF